ncbi:hypothetical protein BJV82DRAFT_59746 [Fennellomyces sp. T-0311]|nr:hypothetical protein BJV82DRAFT_59746 [Fennellomyces sp. T-0311]
MSCDHMVGELVIVGRYSHELPEETRPAKRKWQGYHYSHGESAAQPAEDAPDIYSEKRHRYHPTDSTWQQDLSAHEMDGRPGASKNAFSWQYLSMKQNPRIKRNAMHAYITYMIYTDMTHAHPVSRQSFRIGTNFNFSFPYSLFQSAF